MRSFASDNNSGVSEAVIKKITEVNNDHCKGYGDDYFTAQAEKVFQDQFGEQCHPFMVFTGTAANVMSIASVCAPYHSVLCADSAHIHVDECASPQRFAGCRLETIESKLGKLHPSSLLPYMHTFDVVHHSQPRLISISQPTELGTVYTPEEIKILADFAHNHNMCLHVDGARLANAAVALNLPFMAFTSDLGVDILSFGGTKNGLMTAESVIFLNPGLVRNFKYIRKQGMQLVSKMRFVAAQFLAYFENDLWKTNAQNANNACQDLKKQLELIPEINIIYPVESNAIFAKIPREIIKPLQDKYYFYVWDVENDVVRWMTSYDTSQEDIEGFVGAIKELL